MDNVNSKHLQNYEQKNRKTSRDFTKVFFPIHLITPRFKRLVVVTFAAKTQLFCYSNMFNAYKGFYFIVRDRIISYPKHFVKKSRQENNLK